MEKRNEEVCMATKSTDNDKEEQMPIEKKNESATIKTSIYVPRPLWIALKRLAIDATLESGTVALNTLMVRALEEFVSDEKIDSRGKRNFDSDVSSLTGKYEHWIAILVQVLSAGNERAVAATKTILRVCLRLTELEGDNNHHVEGLADETAEQLAETKATLKRSGDALGQRSPVRRTRRKMA